MTTGPLREPSSVAAGAMLNLLRCAGVRPRSSVYVSAPITTGREYLEWRIAQRHLGTVAPADHDIDFKRSVVQRNIARASGVVEKVRHEYDATVIDPTVLEDIDGWRQNDYHSFWVALIREYVGIVVFVDGWQYSSGAALEYAAALEVGAETLTQDLTELTPLVAQSLLNEAISDFDDAGIPAPLLKRAIRQARR